MPTEEAAQQWRMQGDARRIQPGAFGDVRTEHVRRLIRQPDFQRTIGIESGQRRRRLQLAVVQVLVVVGGVNPGLGAGQNCSHVTLIFIIPGRAFVFSQALEPGITGKVCGHRPYFAVGRGLLPVDLNRFHCTFGVPPALGDHRHGPRQAMHGMHAFHRFDLLFVAQVTHGHAQTRGMLNGGVEHVVDLQVDAVQRFARGLVVGIDALHRFADPAELARITQLHRGRIGNRQIHGVLGQFAVGHRTPGLGVHDFAGFGAQFTHRHPKFLRTGLQQHGAGEGAEAAHHRVTHAHRHAAAGDAHTVFHHHIGFAGRRGFDQECRRVGIQFFTDDLRHRGERTLSAFHERAEQAHAVVRADFQKRRHLRATLGSRGRHCGLHPSRAQRQAETEHQCADSGAGQETSARHVDWFVQSQC